ncbi:hypothetical protein DM02DRAFT_610105 [Periconia macrospinosa]|uniref:Uncharacterized protein n=1 Tax=Periconia macrospinosa TaxID=97972 RepID=A0A2V1E6N3_9PLEO|nr:hypothetical protein DM02DRAFT_610105 [Periconia macrospinosa]
MNAKETNNYPSPGDFGINAIIMIGDDITDAGGKDEASMNIQTYPDNYNRPGRIPYERCMAFESMDNKLTLLQTWGGTCAYYDDKDCKNFLFAQTNREDGQLRGKHDNAVSSAWCTFDLDVKRAPNVK